SRPASGPSLCGSWRRGCCGARRGSGSRDSRPAKGCSPMLTQCHWEIRSSAPAAELVARLQTLIHQQIDFDRNLSVPPQYPKRVALSGFDLAVTPVWGGLGMLLLCSGLFTPHEAGTLAAVRLRISPGTYAAPAAMGLLFGSLLIWGLYPAGL